MRKKQSKKIIVLILLVSLFILSSCGRRVGPIDIYTGTQGITLDFPKNIPPKKVYENQTFLVVAELWNKGSYSFNETRGDFGVVGVNYDPLYFSAASTTNFVGDLLNYEDYPRFFLSGKGYDWPDGERLNKEVVFLKVNEIPGTRESPVVDVGMSVCYPYQTLLSKGVCIDVDTYDADQNPVCVNPGTYSFVGQGAPIAITKIEADMVPASMEEVQPTFRITLKNMQKGVVFTKDDKISTSLAIDKVCNPQENIRNRDDINSLTIEAWLGADNKDSKLKCTPNPVRIYEGDAEVTCFMQGTTRGHNRNYMSLLTIKTNYIYRSQTTKKVRIVRLI